ncbi:MULTISPECIES: hypothetical protein [unclassified Rhizobium]|uniref:hypothetical protein n=1 Tax=unclassified Rhizobium TaxID=2613769 RepID=UPI001C828E11|nr:MULTISPECIES: hypothetical protein [unclassified Rhizobium]MBX5213408.1 hypothetical protein [Rhizobium sp. NLR9a]MBX5243674.1 hypothetical protein [Rhizobium sp. NLR3b]MBX5274239.1 hypothetical protein [Rhizobium sp. NLR13a]MBX5280345.1 hypothetical protein [Rhizobium sp. NLR10a]MBX5294592.1 hypothetical protein [Rhizobium sp. NLR15a]
MRSLYRKTLYSSWPLPANLHSDATSDAPPPPVGVFTILNGFDIPIYLSSMLSPASKSYVAPGDPGQLPFIQDDVCILQAAQTGSYMCSIIMQTDGEIVPANYMLLTSPNDIGPVPQPTASMLVPPDSPRVLVGCSTLADGKTVLREQFWDRQGDSCTLAPGEKKTITTTVTTGRQETSTHESTLAASLGMNANVGFGPFSASVSSSLSMTSRSFQQVTVSEQNTAYFADELTNPYTDQACLVLRWQLTDVITIFQPDGPPCGSVIIGESPIITEIYGINDLPKTLPRFELGDEDYALIAH